MTSKERASALSVFDRITDKSREDSESKEETGAVKPKQSAKRESVTRGGTGKSITPGAPPPVWLPVSQVAIWPLANRIVFDSEAQRSLEDSILNYGQTQPVLVRPLASDDERREKGIRYELIYGSRRLRAAENLAKEILARVVDLDDKNAVLEMEIENRERSDISVYERAVDYARWIERGLFQSANEIAEHVGRNRTAISRYLAIARLPASVLFAFPDPDELSFTFGYDLAAAMERFEGGQEAIDREARALSEIDAERMTKEQRRKRLISTVTATEKKESRQESNNFQGIPTQSLKGRTGINLGRVSVSGKGQIKLQTVSFADPDKAARVAQAIAEQVSQIIEDGM